ncbi:hypothetical protein [Bradyrhizobium erythrophlei]|uniref:Uncharacterized protein n=1 Tax=Bradyrhizobium erythrophlei TaxID=1437360 RepID=A0A1M5NEX0_9BRAD|nr:hypothetical protein [Bradyrhizobium erythrophlei]SHG88015.1 hypothetical protein SAMN05443248_2966 [Bradyrhizobium erythrophlei]
MANLSKRRPWAVEIQPPDLDRWYVMQAYRDEDEAEAGAALMRKRSPKATFRVRKVIV